MPTPRVHVRGLESCSCVSAACVCMCLFVRVRVQGPVSRAGSCLRACVVACVHVHGSVYMAWARVHMCLHAHAPAHVGVCEHVAVARLGHQHWAAWCGTSVPSSGPVVDGVRSWRPRCHPRLGLCRPWRCAYPGLTCAPSSLPCVQCGSSLPLRSSSVVFASGKLLDLFAMLGQVS